MGVRKWIWQQYQWRPVGKAHWAIDPNRLRCGRVWSLAEYLDDGGQWRLVEKLPNTDLCRKCGAL